MMGNGCRISVQRHRKVTLPPGYSQLHWMRLTQSGQDLSGLRGRPKRKGITMEEVCRHNSEDDCWTVLDGRVYNLTSYLKFHPGGVHTLMMSAGADCTALFNEYHAWVNGHSMLEKCYIGDLDPDSVTTDDSTKDASPYALDMKEWRSFKLVQRQQVSKQTVKFTFELPAGKKLGLTIPGQHLKLRATIKGKPIERAFTPTSKFGQMGSFDLIIKLYPDGVMSQYLETLEVGATIEMLGPHGLIGYPSPNTITHGSKTVHDSASHLVLIAAGSGITPMLQIIRSVFERSEDTSTKITLVYANRSLESIIALDQIEPLGNMFPNRIKIHHVLTHASAEDKRELGQYTIERLSKAMLEDFLPPYSSSLAAFHCGPPEFDEAVGKALRELQYKEHQIHLF